MKIKWMLSVIILLLVAWHVYRITDDRLQHELVSKQNRLAENSVTNLLRIESELSSIELTDKVDVLNYLRVYDDVVVVELMMQNGDCKYFYLYDDGRIGTVGRDDYGASDIVTAKLHWCESIRRAKLRETEHQIELLNHSKNRATQPKPRDKPHANN